jgi:hypothetical protein
MSNAFPIQNGLKQGDALSPLLQNMICGYEIPRIILLQAYVYTYRLLRGVTFKVLPLSSYALCSVMLPLLEKFLELLLWSSFLCSHHIFLGYLQYPEIFGPLRQTLFLETATSHLEPNQGNMVGVPFHQSIFGPETV